jgi:TolA-binding protein
LAAWTLALSAATAAGQTIAELEKDLRDKPTSIKAKAALAEGYLRACELEKSLALWRQVLEQDADHARAKYVVAKLSLQLVDLDVHLRILGKLIEAGATDGMQRMLDDAASRAATEHHKAQMLYLRGRLHERTAGEAAGAKAAKARASYLAAVRLYPNSRGAAWSAIALGRGSSGEEARRLLRSVAENAGLADEAARETARVELELLDSADLGRADRVAAIRRVLEALRTPTGRRRAIRALIRLSEDALGRWTEDAVVAAAAFLDAEAPFGEAHAMLDRLLAFARTSRHAAALDRLLDGKLRPKLPDVSLRQKYALAVAEAAMSRAALAEDIPALRRFIAQAREALARIDAPPDGALYPRQLQAAYGRAWLVEGQKLTALGAPHQALPALMNAKDHCLSQMPTEVAPALERLRRIASLLEHVKEWETAVALCREVAERFPELPEGRDALWRAAWLMDARLNDAAGALELYAQYAARYPAELPYRQLGVGRRLRQLGYANLLDFQKRSGLKPDGIFGPKTRAKLEELEASLDEIALKDGQGDILRGRFAHPTILAIARRLEAAGRHDQAVGAYRLFLNLFPTKKGADDALIAIARLFRENLLFEEAIAAYRRMMEDFPKGNMTSLAYIEGAGCLENLGRWKEARSYYDLYVRKFPKYEHVALCRRRMALMDELQQYHDFIAENPHSPKLPEAKYQIAAVLYKQLGNCTKAAIAFAKVAADHPNHVRAPDGLFTAGVAHLRTENFPAARAVFAQLVRRYPHSRLADDGQYWIAHTYEYAARALGRLDAARIVLKRRSLRARAALVADVGLRRQYHEGAQAGPAVEEQVWGGDTLGVLASGSKRDRVNADLRRAIAAYRKVVDDFEMGDMAGKALLRIGTIYTKYLKEAEKAIEAYRQLLAHYPGSKEAVDALYEVGVYYLERKDYEAAIEAFGKFMFNYPREEKVQEAMLAVAKCYVEMKAWDKALDAYQRYLNKFPHGRHAARAKAQIEWIRMYHF